MVKGAVLHGDAPRLLHVDGIDVEAPLERNLIYLRNRDVPGVIGKVGTILGEESINIADFSLGRRECGERFRQPREAIAVVHVDGRVPEEVLAKLRTDSGGAAGESGAVVLKSDSQISSRVAEKFRRV